MATLAEFTVETIATKFRNFYLKKLKIFNNWWWI